MCALVTGVQTCALPIFHREGRGYRIMANAVVNVVERRAIVNLVGPGAALAMDAASEAKAAAAQADATRDSVLISAAAKGAFPDTATGIAGTVSGDYFYAASGVAPDKRSDEHTSELQSLMRISYAVFCLNKKKHHSDDKDQPRLLRLREKP